VTLVRTEGGVCAARGFVSAGVKAGIKKSGSPDVALILSESDAACAGVFTTNTAAAAPVAVTRERVKSGKARGVVVNSGCANALTGEQGIKDARSMASIAARATGVDEEQMLVCSTGHIGVYLPMDKLTRGIEEAVSLLRPADEDAMRAIMTTDTRPKRAAMTHKDGWTIGGITKGAGMIAPRMATTLGFITTDAAVESAALQDALSEVAEVTYNAITIDGDTSTNDTLLVFANGASGLRPDVHAFAEALRAVAASLAEQIVSDGEGATKVVRVRVRGAADADQAWRAARTVAESLLVKTMIYGGDANWGRVAAALGRSGATVNFDKLSISIGGAAVLKEGIAAPETVVAQARAAMQSDEFAIVCDLLSGSASAEMLTTDLSERYVELNAKYET